MGLLQLAYHQLPDDTLVEIFEPSVDTLGDEVTAIDMLFSHAPFPLLSSCDSILLQLPGVFLLLRLSSGFNGGSFFGSMVGQA